MNGHPANQNDLDNRNLIAYATRAAISSYTRAREGSLAAISRIRSFSEVAAEIGNFMGYGRSTFSTRGNTLRLDFERGDRTVTFVGDVAPDRAQEMVYRRWVMEFMLEVA